MCVGADVDLKAIVMRAVTRLPDVEVIAPFRVANNFPGEQAAVARLLQVATDLNYTCIQIGYEATGMLLSPFHRFLKTSPLFGAL